MAGAMLKHLFAIARPSLLVALSVAWGEEPVRAQLVINEVCSRNISVLEDPLGRHPDWVELYNSGNTGVQLSDHYLSDRVTHRAQWRLPEMMLAPGNYVVLYAGKDGDGPLHFNFSIASAGEGVHLSDLALNPVHSLLVPSLRADHSFGLADGIPRYFAEPTPGTANTTEAFLGYAPMPLATKAPGRYTGPLTVQLSHATGTNLHFSTDGRDPDLDMPLLADPLVLTSTTVVKALASGPGLLPSDLFVASYLINVEHDLPVISLSTHPDSLWDWNRGIYMFGPEADTAHPYRGANFWRNNHIPGHFEFFDEGGNLGLSQRVDIRMHGGSQARTRDQRPFRITARSRYGSNSLSFPFFPERGRLETYKQLVLRNSSGDFCLSNFRDGFWHQVSLHNDLDIDVLGFRPVVLYLNGNYWGWMNLRERINLGLLANDYGANIDSVLLMNQENVSVQGDTIHFHNLREHIIHADLAQAANWNVVEDQFDLHSFKDYMVLEMFAGNVDWPANNVRYWKPALNSGKWRYLMHDLDATMNVYGWITMDVDMFWLVLEHRADKQVSMIFASLLGVPEFKRTFLNRFADLMNTAFREERLLEEKNEILDLVTSEAPRHYARWNCDLGQFNLHNHTLLPEFFSVRAGHVRNHILSRFSLPNDALLGFETFPPGAGRIDLNTIRPELPFEGYYFNGNPIDLLAHAEEGYVFDHWSYGPEPEFQDRTARLQRSFAEHGTITAYFRREGQDLQAFPNPFSTTLNLGLNAEQAGLAEVTVYDLRGSVVYTSTAAVSEGQNRIALDLGQLSAGTYLVSTTLNGARTSTRVIKLPY